MPRALAIVALACLAPALPTAPAQPTSPQPAPTGAEPRQVKLADMPPAQRLGARAEVIRRGWPVISAVVIVPDEPSFIEAIAAWTLQARYPVLIDDGSHLAREDIARFVRAFKPSRVVRWKSGKPWPADAAEQRRAIESGLFRVWRGPLQGETEAAQVDSAAALLDRWKRVGIAPPGVVVADPADPAWPAALALAAGRCQPIVWVGTESNVNAELPAEKAAALAAAIESGCDSSSLPWRELGDALDAVTLCLNAPAKVNIAGQIFAATDLLGRLPEGEGTDAAARAKGKRWAWCGQIFGTPAQSSYRAMCSLFISPRTAWLFDGYKDQQPWSRYDQTAAAGPLRTVGLNATVDDTPDQGERAWRQRSASAVDAGLITVNTHGGAEEFNLEPGRCRPGDIPFLSVPSVVYFVHSYSAKLPAERMTVAGRWLERGGYAYFGSTDEPYLHAFVPTPALTARLASTFPWGAAVRFDDHREAWKVATFGDPLITLGPAPTAAAIAVLPLSGVENVEDTLRSAAAGRRFEEVIVAMTLLGRDSDVGRLVGAVIRDDPGSFSARVAAAAVLPLFRSGDTDLIVKCFGTFAKDQADGPLRDALWHACYNRIPGTRDEAMLGALRANMRPDQLARDAAELTRPVALLYGREAAAAMLADAAQKAMSGDDKSRVDDALKMLNLLPSK